MSCTDLELVDRTYRVHLHGVCSGWAVTKGRQCRRLCVSPGVPWCNMHEPHRVRAATEKVQAAAAVKAAWAGSMANAALAALPPRTLKYRQGYKKGYEKGYLEGYRSAERTLS